MHPVLKIICGPTASGKSQRALDIAQTQGGVIINADAMQVYKELRILTARPTPQDETIAPHKLYGVLCVADACSAARWLALAKTAIDETLSAGKTPIITGGTGLYIKALMEGLSDIPQASEAHRAEATALWNKDGDKALLVRDPVMHARLKAGDSQRHVRALEVLLATGKSLAHWQEQPRNRPYPNATFEVEYITLPRKELYARCDTRFITMMQTGALEEARDIHALHLSSDLPAMRAVGLKELFKTIEGKWSQEEAIAAAQQATRNYAKRQETWFKHQLKQA